MESLQDKLNTLVAQVQPDPDWVVANRQAIEEPLGVLYHDPTTPASTRALVQTAWDAAQQVLAQYDSLLTTSAETAQIAVQAAVQLDVALHSLDNAIRDRDTVVDQLTAEETRRFAAEQARAAAERERIALAKQAADMGQELTTINTAIEGVNEGLLNYNDIAHEGLAEMATAISEQVREEVFEGPGLFLQCPGATAMENGWYVLLHQSAVDSLSRVLFQLPADVLPTDVQEFIAVRVNAIGKRLDEYFQEQREAAYVDLDDQPEEEGAAWS